MNTTAYSDIDIVYGGIDDLRRLYINMERDFPEDERKELEHLEMLMLKNQYKLLLAKNRVFHEIIGYAMIYKADKNKVLWLDYLAIEEKYRSCGYGTLLFNKIVEAEGEGITGIFIEVEIADKTDIEHYDEQKKRIRFYERLGAKCLKFNYILPTNDGGTPLHLYFKPVAKLTVLSKEQIAETISSAFNYIHSDVNERDSIFKKFLNEIEDVYFE